MKEEIFIPSPLSEELEKAASEQGVTADRSGKCTGCGVKWSRASMTFIPLQKWIFRQWSITSISSL